MSNDSEQTNMPIAITLDPGTYYRCSCGQSQNLPFCDESHHGGKNFPVEFSLTERQKIYLCGCGKTSTNPFCDGQCGVDLTKL